jgi:hypothetical protein
MEAVVEIETATGGGSRIIHIGEPATQNTEMGMTIDDAGLVELRWNGNTHVAEWNNTNLLGGGRHVVHLVVDVDAQARARLYLDGQELPATGASGPGQGEVLSLMAISELVLFNRTEGARTFEGVGYYAAIYDTALSPQDVSANAQALLAWDDG